MLRSKCLCPEGSLEVLRTLQNTDSVLQVVGKAIAEIKEGNKQDSRRSDSPVMRKSDSCSEEE